tara:strand:- start:531 stop:860 length:330 start_codon:yes stop_codon:yes gene_type:complete
LPQGTNQKQSDLNDITNDLSFFKSQKRNHKKKPLPSYLRSSSSYYDGFKNALEKLTQLDLMTQRYDNVLLYLQTLKKHQRRNKYGSSINIPDPEQEDLWTSLENELHHL